MTLSDALERLSVKIEKATDDYLATGDVDLGRFTRAERDILARRDLIGQIKDSVRYRTLQAERGAESQDDVPNPGRRHVPIHERPDAAHGTAKIAMRTDCGCDKCSRYRVDRAEFDRRRDSELFAIIKQYSEELRMEWTLELLSSPFALADGTLVTWGEATVEHHAERVELFQRNAAANLEGAARHQAALRDLGAAGAACLNELVDAGQLQAVSTG